MSIGVTTKVKDALNAIDFDAVSPVLYYYNQLYVVHTHGRTRGSISYTVFQNPTTPLHTITTPFSFADTLGQIFTKANQLRPKDAPIIEEIPASGYAVVYKNKPLSDLFDN